MPRKAKKPFVLFSLFFLLTTAGFAQKNDFSISVSATVVKSTIELTTLKSMQLNRAQPDQQTIEISPVDDNNAGKMEASGNPGAAIRISFLGEWELINTNGGKPLQFHYAVAGNSRDNQETAELLDTENRALHFSDAGKYYLWIGGKVDISNAEPGNYIGEFTIEIEYM